MNYLSFIDYAILNFQPFDLNDSSVILKPSQITENVMINYLLVQ